MANVSNETILVSNDLNDTSLMQDITQLNNVAYNYMMPMLLACGILSNLTNINCLHNLGGSRGKKQQRSTTTYMYLYWLAVAQLFACVSVIPSLIHLYRESLSYPWAFYFAHFEIVFMNSLTSTCVYIVVGLSVDRFVAVCRPHAYQLLKGVRQATIRIVACFIVPPVFYSPLSMFQMVERNKDETGYHPVDNAAITSMHFWQFWNAGIELCHRFIPAVVIVILNCCIIIQYKKVRASVSTRVQQASVDGEPSKNQLASTTVNKGKTDHDSKMFLLLAGVIIVFLVTNLPSAFLGLTDSFGHKYESYSFEVFRAVANLLEILGFSLNFFLYFFLVSEVKEKFDSCISSCTSRQKTDLSN